MAFGEAFLASSDCMEQCWTQSLSQSSVFRRRAHFAEDCARGVGNICLLGPRLDGSLSCASVLPTAGRSSSLLAASVLHWTSIPRKSSRYLYAVVPSSLNRKIKCIDRPLFRQLRIHGCQRDGGRLSSSRDWNLCSLRTTDGVNSSAVNLQAITCQHANGSGLCHETAEVTAGSGHAILRAFLLAMACAFLFSSRAAYAVDSGTVRLPPVPQQFKDVVGLFWPKFVLVLGVFRDQGLLLTVLLSLSAFFSMAETSITTLWPWKVRELAEKETEGGVFQMLRRDVTRFLTTILIGTTVANIAATALVTDAATALFGQAGVTAATGVMTVVILLLTEITPKSIAVHNATEVARVVVRPVAWLSYVLYPVGRIVTAISMGLLKILGLKSSGEPFVTEEELKLMLRGAELSGSIEEEEQDMIENVLEIKDTYVREVMTPLVDVVAIDASATLLDFRNLWVTHQYSRVPVFERRVDNIIGVAFAMDMLDYVGRVELLQKLTVGRITHKPGYFVPDSMSVWNLLREFRIRKVHMAIVLNEYGGTVGVVTLEDVVEEIVGEIFDENDSKEEIRRKTGYVVQRADGVFDVDANTSIEDLAEALELKFPEGPYHYETVSGFVCEAFGYIPRTGESINIILQKVDDEGSDRNEGDSDNQEDRREKFQKYKLEILAGNARKVGSVRFERLDESEPKIDGNTATRVAPSILRHSWEGEQGPDHVTIDNGERSGVSWDSDGESEEKPVSDAEGDACITNTDTLKNGYLIAECIDVDHTSDSESVVTTELTFVGDQEWDVKEIDGRHDFALETNDVDMSTGSAVDTLNEKCEQHESFVEKRRQRRRKQSAEAAIELDKHRKVYIKRKEAVMGMRLNKKQDEQQSEQGRSFNGDKM